jgi:predicted amino acid dehydrogenase
VGPDDDFFALGGDSILVLEMLQRLRGLVPVVPRPLTLYGQRTLRALARTLDALAAAPADAPSAEAAPPGPGAGALSPSQESFVLAGRLRPDATPVIAVRLPVRGALDLPRLRAVLEAAVQRHGQLRTVIETRGVVTTQREVEPGPLPLAVEDLRGLPAPAQAERLAAREEEARRARLAPGTWPPWTLRLVRLAEDRWEWLIALHHAFGDGWSLARLGEEVLEHYAALETGAPAPAPPRSTYADAVACRHRRQGEGEAAARRFFRDQLGPAPDPTLLGDAVPEADPGAPVAARLDAAATRALREAARAGATSLHHLLLTALFRGLRPLTGPGDLVVGTAVSGRDLPLPDVDRVFGCFTTGLPVRAVVTGGALADDRASVAAAFAATCRHADLPVTAILEEARREGGWRRPPGSAFIMSLLDRAPGPGRAGAGPTLDWEEAAIHFAAQSTGTELLVGVLAGERLALRVHGAAPRVIREQVLAALVAELEATARPAGPAAHARPEVPDDRPLDTAIVAYLPALARLVPGLAPTTTLREQVLDRVFGPGRLPRRVEVLNTRLGRTGAILIPELGDALPTADPAALAGLVADAVRLAGRQGARAVSLAGMLPVFTGHGAAVRAALAGSGPVVTTGHAATTVAMALTVERLLARLGRRLPELAVAVVGFGSIGQASLGLILELMGEPRRLLLCDRPAQLPFLERPVRALADRLGDRVAVVPAGPEARAALREVHLVIAATSEAETIDVAALAPGTLVVDDSLPAAVDVAAARGRMVAPGDVVICGGGRLDLGDTTRLLPRDLDDDAVTRVAAAWDAPGLPGCRVEPLLLLADPGLQAVTGMVTPDLARRYLEAAARAGLRPAPLHLGPGQVPETTLDAVASLLAGRCR